MEDVSVIKKATEMNAEHLLAHFDRIADAPDAIPRLRRFVLDLAVRGKLVPQDPNDEPASELLKRIAAERERLVKVGEIRETKKSYPIGYDSFLFENPPGWMWSRLGEISRKIHYGYTASANPKIDSIRFLRITDIQNSKVKWHSVPGCEIDEKALSNFKLEGGDILIARTGGTIGKSFLVIELPVVAVFASYLIRVQSSPEIYARYLKFFFESPTYWTQLQEGTKGAGQPNVNGRTLGKLLVPLPPLAEQHRIVAKVDELMALCDRLEAARVEREATRNRMATASLARLNAPDPDPATFQNHAAFALNNLTPLTTRPDQIKALRQTILNLAVCGKLVPQDPNDKPAAELLEEIEADRCKQSRSKRGRLPIASPERQKEEVPYAIPEIWVWAPFGHITISLDGERIPISKEERSSRPKLYDYYGASGVIDKIDNYLFDKPLLLIGEDGANLINRSTPIAFIARGKYWVNNHAHVLDGFSEDFLRYIELFVNAIDLKPYVTGTAQPKMNQAKMNSIPVALPPLAEQHRIVAKVDELMALCDRLEASLTTDSATRHHLLDALLHETSLGPSAQCRSGYGS